MNPTQLEAIVRVHAEKQASLTAQLLRILLGIWIPFAWANRPDLVHAAAARSAVDVDIALAQARRLARAEIIEQLRALDALPTQLPPLEDLYPRSGTALVEVYKRPARQAEHALRQGATLDQAETVLVERVTRLVSADVAAVARDEKSIVRAASPKVIGYRRILHPELTRFGPCGLCIVAADQVYSTNHLDALHNGCVCGTAEITTAFDPGARLNRADLEAIYDAAGSKYAEDLQRTRITIRENGELGPILVRDGDSFKTFERAESQSNRGQQFTPYSPPTKQTNRNAWTGMRERAEKTIRTIEQARADGTETLPGLTDYYAGPVTAEDYDKAIAYFRDLIARAQSYGG